MSADDEMRSLLAVRARAAALVARIDRRMPAAALRFSDARGYRVPLRPEQIKRELEGRG
jgi:hypothetical protein